MQIPRTYEDLEKHLKENKALVLFGPRQVGKTTLLQNYLKNCAYKYVIVNVRSFSRNLRKEISKKCKYYFYDTGIRNAIIANFNGLELRNDIGALWENFLFMERLKKRTYQEIFANYYFWRTWEGKELDLIEEREGRLFGYEFKWGQKKRSAKGAKAWLAAYPEASMEIIDRENYLSFIT